MNDLQDGLVLLEQQVMAECLRSREFASRAATLLTGFDFAFEQHRLLWGVIQRSWQHREKPDDAVLQAVLAATKMPADQREAVEGAWDRIQCMVASTAPLTLLDLLRQFAMTQAIAKSGQALLESVNQRGSPEGVQNGRKEVEKLIARMRQIDGIKAPQGWITGLSERAARRLLDTDRKWRIPLPGGSLLKATGGGLPPGRVVLLMATTNIGKSTAAAAFGAHALRHSKDVCVVHIVTEELVEDAENRYDAHFAEIDREKFAACELTENDWGWLNARYEEKFPYLETQLALYAVPKLTPVRSVLACIDDMRKNHPDKMILVIIDSPDHLVSGQRHDQVRHDITHVWNVLDSAARDPAYHPISFLVTTHAAKEAEGKIALNRNVAEDYNKSRISHFSISIDDRGTKGDDHLFWFAIVKNRIGKLNRIVVPMHVNLGTCTMTQAGPHWLLGEDEDE